MSLFFKQKYLPGKVEFNTNLFHSESFHDRRMESIILYLRKNYKSNQHIDRLIRLLREKNKAFNAIINHAMLVAETNRFTPRIKTHHSKIETNKAKLNHEIQALKDFQTVFYESIATIIAKPSLLNEAKNYFKDVDCYSRVGGKHGKRSFTIYDDLSEDAMEISLIFLLTGTTLLATSSLIPVFLPIGIAVMAIAAILLAPSLFYFLIETLPNIISTWLEEKKLFDALEIAITFKNEDAPEIIDIPSYHYVNQFREESDDLEPSTTTAFNDSAIDKQFHEFIPESQQIAF